jgi:hypothetical protein
MLFPMFIKLLKAILKPFFDTSVSARNAIAAASLTLANFPF